jgi:hypothetical protein
MTVHGQLVWRTYPDSLGRLEVNVDGNLRDSNSDA